MTSARGRGFLGGTLAQRLLLPVRPLRQNSLLGYCFAVASFALALALRWTLDETLPPGFPFITFFPAILLTAFLAGARAATLCAVLSLLAAWYFFVGPPGSFAMTLGAQIALGFFVFIVTVDIAIIEAVVRALDELAIREAQLETIVETVPVGLVMAEFPSGRIVGGNKYVEQMMRHPVLLSPNLNSYDEWVSFHADGSRVKGHEYPLARMMMEGEERPQIEVHYERGDGSRAWMLIMGRPVRNQAGVITGGVVALVDIDEERKAKEALEDAVKAKETLLYEVNHRVKNSLQLVTSLLLIEASKISDAQARNAVMVARDKIATVSRLHQRLYSDGSHDTVDFVAFLKDLIADIASAAEQETIDMVVTDGGSKPLNIRLSVPLAMAVNELVTNSIKHAFPEGKGRIEVSFANLKEEVCLAVSDNGAGLPAGCDPFSASSTGMQIVTGLVRQVGGELRVESSSEGTTFWITLTTLAPQ